MNDFARTQLLKYGWSEGKGLGKHENGIAEALKPTLKFDTAGIGHKNDDYNNWWENAFNKAANNITVKSETNGVSISISKKHEDPLNGSKGRNSKSSTPYRNFLKSSVLFNGNLIGDNTGTCKTENIKQQDVSCTSLTDEELFKVCGGRTGHKGARHGLTLSGKLNRIAQQEEALLNKNSYLNTSNKLENNSSITTTINNNNICDEYEKIDGTEHAPTTSAGSVEEVIEKKVSKTVKRKTKRCINDLSHKLNILCNLSDSDAKTETNDKIIEEESMRKSEGKKKKRRDFDSCTVKTEKDVSYSGSRKFEKEIIKKNSEACTNNNSDTTTEYTRTSRTKKRKKLKNKKKQDEFDERQAKKFKRLDEDVDSLLVEGVDFLEYGLQREHFFKDPVEPHAINNPTCPMKVLEAATTADHLNKKLRKKKRAKRLKKERIKLEKLTECLEAVHFDIQKQNAEQRDNDDDDTKQLEQASGKLINNNIAVTDRTESLKRRRKRKNKSK